jgi:predicted nuclease of restriction endonuclease-like (RecB) superfamily
MKIKRAKPSQALARIPKAVPDADARRVIGRSRGEKALFPVHPPVAGLPPTYAATLREIRKRVSKTRVSAVLAANAAMVLLYWDIGQIILARQGEEGWGARVIDRLAFDLREAFPDMEGFSSRNLKYMRAFAVAWPSKPIVQQLVAQLPWGQNLVLLARLEEPATRIWYAEQVIAHGWSRSILAINIQRQLHKRAGRAVNNFKATLPPPDSDLAAQVFKDPYLFDFLGTADPRRERDVEDSLVAHIERFLLEMGAGFAFVGRQVALEVGDQDFRIDLLFYHLKLRSFVVVELKSVPFEPAFVGQLNFYLSVVDDLLKHPSDRPTIGLLLCRSKNELVVEYALRDLNRPVGVADWETKIVEKLPKDLEGSLPTIEQIEAELAVVTPKRKPRAPKRNRM